MPSLPVMSSGPVTTPGKLRPHLDVKLGADWRYLKSERMFVSSGGQVFSPASTLPKGAEVLYTAPGLAQADPCTLSEDERNLARFVQVIFRNKAARKKHFAQVEKWSCVEVVRWPPEVSLP